MNQEINSQKQDEESPIQKLKRIQYQKAQRRKRRYAKFDFLRHPIAAATVPFKVVQAVSEYPKKTFPETVTTIEKAVGKAVITIAGITTIVLANGYLYISLKEGGATTQEIESLIGLCLPGVFALGTDGYVLYWLFGEQMRAFREEREQKRQSDNN